MSDDTAELTPEVVPSLDDVINDFNANQGQQNIQPSVDQIVTPQENTAPQNVPQTLDPFDEGQMNNFVQSNQNQFGQMNGQMQDLNQRLANFEQSQQTQAIESDIKSAVDFVNKIAGHDNDKWIEFQLQEKARTNQGFMNIWENRANNPTAFSKALTAIGNELKSGTDMLSDPQLVENQRAANQSQTNMNTGIAETTSLEESLSSATNESQRQSIWNQAIGSY